LAHKEATIGGTTQCVTGLAEEMGYGGFDEVEVTVFQVTFLQLMDVEVFEMFFTFEVLMA
jgi:hypothetical protein